MAGVTAFALASFWAEANMGVVKMPPGAWIGALVAEATILGLAFGFCAQLPPGRDSGGR